MWPDRVSNPGPLTYESGALPTALRGPAGICIALCTIISHLRTTAVTDIGTYCCNFLVVLLYIMQAKLQLFIAVFLRQKWPASLALCATGQTFKSAAAASLRR